MAIEHFRSKKLKAFWCNNDESKVAPDHHKKVDDILSAIEASHQPKDLKAQFGSEFEQKKGNAKGVYAIWVNANFRITFEIGDWGAVVLDYYDYHGKNIKKK